MNKKNIIVLSIWIFLFGLLVFTKSSQMLLALLFTLFVLTFSENFIKKYLSKNNKLNKYISTVISVFILVLIVFGLYFAISFMSKDLLVLIKESQNHLHTNLGFLGIHNLDDIIEKLNNFVKENMQILSNSLVTILKIFIGFILGFVFYFSSLKFKSENTLEAAIINDLRRYGQKIFSAFKNIIEVQIVVAILNTLVISILSFCFYLYGETLPFWYIIIPTTFVLSLIPVIGNLLINLFLLLSTIQISLIAAIIGISIFLVAHKLELIIIGKKIKEKINVSFILVLMSMLIGELLFNSMAGMLLGMVFMLAICLITRDIEYKVIKEIK